MTFCLLLLFVVVVVVVVDGLGSGVRDRLNGSVCKGKVWWEKDSDVRLQEPDQFVMDYSGRIVSD